VEQTAKIQTHFVANRSLKALITESSAANTCAPSTRPAAACRAQHQIFDKAYLC
jgi:hypothetical protein